MTTRHRFNRLFQIGINAGVVQNRFGVHTNVVVNDEFQTRQTHARIGQLAKVKCQLWVAHVHHDFGFDGWHLATQHFGHFGFQQAIINKTGVAFGTAHSHQIAIFQ